MLDAHPVHLQAWQAAQASRVEQVSWTSPHLYQHGRTWIAATVSLATLCELRLRRSSKRWQHRVCVHQQEDWCIAPSMCLHTSVALQRSSRICAAQCIFQSNAKSCTCM